MIWQDLTIMHNSKTGSLIKIFVTAAILSAGSHLAIASSFTASGSGSDGSLSAQAVFTPGSGSLALTVTNLLTAETSIGQSVSDISFSISGVTGNASYTGGSANAISISGSGVTSTSPASPASAGFGWGLSTSGTTITLEGAGSLHQGKPVDLIVGSGPYGANGKTNTGGFDAHDPSLQDSATFDLSIPGVTSGSIISNVIFSFGTGPDTYLPGTPSSPGPSPGPGPTPVPEPASIFLVGTALAITAKVVSRRVSA
jgi:hypothetical protein